MGEEKFISCLTESRVHYAWPLEMAGRDLILSLCLVNWVNTHLPTQWVNGSSLVFKLIESELNNLFQIRVQMLTSMFCTFIFIFVLIFPRCGKFYKRVAFQTKMKHKFSYGNHLYFSPKKRTV